MNIVIVGAGEVGQHLADILSREEHAVTVVDPDPSKSRRMTESLDVQALVGDGTRADTLTSAGASTAHLVIAVSDDDHVNMLTSVVAKKLGAERVILRLKDTQVLTDFRYFYKDALGFHVVLDGGAAVESISRPCARARARGRELRGRRGAAAAAPAAGVERAHERAARGPADPTGGARRRAPARP